MADITITEGDTLEVEYTLENTGGETGTFDPRLLVQGVQEDQDTGITLNPAQTATGTLQWPTVDGDAVTDALAEAVTDDTSDSITVTVESAIPPSGVSRWEFEQTVTDSWGANDWADNTSAGYTTNAQVGQYAKEFDGIDDYLENGDIITETGAWTLTAWVYVTDSDKSVFYSTDENNAAPRGFQFQVLSDGTIQLFDGNSVANTSLPFSRNAWQFIALATENDGDVTIDIGGSRKSVNANFNDTPHPLWLGVRSDTEGGHLTGRVDDARYYNKKLSNTELDNLRTTGGI